MKKPIFSLPLLFVMMLIMCGTVDSYAQVGPAGTIRAEFDVINADGSRNVAAETLITVDADVTVPSNFLVGCITPFVWSGDFYTGETSPKPFEVEASLQFDGQTIATKFRNGNLNANEPFVFDIDPFPAIAGTYKIVYRYRKKRCFKLGKPLNITVCPVWDAWQTKESKAIIIPSGAVSQVYPFSLNKTVCSNDYSSGAFGVNFCRYNTVEFSITGTQTKYVENVYPQLSGTTTFNFNEIASQLGINVVLGGTYNITVCAKARAGGLFIGGESCKNMTFSYNCCSSIPNGNFNVMSLGDRCAGGSFTIFVTNPEPDATYSFSTSVPGITITSLSGTAANVSTSASTPIGMATFNVTATTCAGSQSSNHPFEIFDPFSSQCGIIQRLAEDKLQIEPQLFPNPMQGKAVLRFELPETNRVELALLNTLGQVVAKPLAAQKLNAGPQEIAIRREQLSAGLYFYQLRVGNEVFTGKVLME
ncbi:MAG: T9SS type A sorting domain-containing protein [Bacteroidota bacterium]